MLFINNCIFKCHIKIRILLGTIAAILDNLATVSADISQLAAAIGGVGVPGAQLMREQGVIYRNGWERSYLNRDLEVCRGQKCRHDQQKATSPPAR